MNIADSTMLRTILCHSDAASGVHSISSAGPDSSRARKPSIDCTLKAGITPPRNGSMQFRYQPILISSPNTASDSSTGADDRRRAAGDHAPASAQQHIEPEQHQRQLEQRAQAEHEPGGVFRAGAPEQQRDHQQQQDEMRGVAFAQAVDQRAAGEDRERQHRAARRR